MDNPQLHAVHQFLKSQLTEASDLSLDGMRTNLDNVGRLAPPLPGVTREVVDTGVVRSEWIRPADADEGRAILFVHGGGYMLGSVDSHRDLISRIAVAAKAPALAIEYRRAPEHPFPAGLDDTLASYRWLVGPGGYAPAKVALVGESAGAGLLLGAALQIRDTEGLDSPGALVCMSPWTDLTLSSSSLATVEDPSMKAPYVAMMAQAYLAGQDPKTPGASPLHAELAGLPPILLQAGAAEALRDDSERFAERCKEAGVDVTLELWDDMFHAFQLWAAMLDEAKRAIEAVGEFTRARTS
ncbi:Monoterpene epsilon-lactone hydrolase [Enhygromyxa salina]|uniref:Monoterpene epsilon-lactone hydrolase n=1 Tax=Enhygromyxa salina TaxID=215803 RepID=A0A2S9XXV9_9BACT|nr:alpha/beta hydrolase [Enhygromyxa salina]PRP97705.1 Monoterpene epsilon-lactone hydrolase [Enhygromyxa salina]